jgi:site-specific recombinase XerD
MIINNNTIEYKEKLELQYNQRMNALLTELPSFCTEYEIYLREKNSLKTRMEYIFDIYNFFKYLVKVDAEIKTVTDVTAETLEKLTGADFDKYLEWLSNYKFDEKNENEKPKTNSQASKKRKIMSIKSLYSFLFVKGYISYNSSLEATVPKVTKKPREAVQILTEAQCKSFMNIIDVNYKRAKRKLAETSEDKHSPKDKMRPHLVIRDKAIALLMLDTGLRVSELCAINCGDISFNSGALDVVRMGEGDGKTISRIELSEEVLDILKHYLYDARDNIGANEDNFDALFLSSIHRRITPRSVELMVKKYAAEALGKDHTVHPRVLRATFENRNTVAD